MDNQKNVRLITENISKIIVGKDKIIELVTVAMLSGGHVLLEDVPGVGKTTLANALAASIDLGFTRIQFTPDTMPSDVTGMSIYNMSTGKFEFIQGAIMNNIILADEINRTSPKTQASLLEAMEEGQVTVDGHTYKLPDPFMVIATKNPTEHLGTYNLPQAQLDRYMLRVSMGYPSMEEEVHMANNYLQQISVNKLQSVVTKQEVLHMRNEVTKVNVHKDIIQYIIELVDKTRSNKNISLGASPRATLSLLRASQGLAYIRGRDYIVPDDVKYMLPYVLGHRIMLSSEAKMNGRHVKDIMIEVIGSVKVPLLT